MLRVDALAAGGGLDTIPKWVDIQIRVITLGGVTCMAQPRFHRLSVGLIVALVIILVLQPTLYTLIRPRLIFGPNVDTATRTYRWLTTGWVLLWVWLPFGMLCWVIHHGRYKW